MSKRVKQAPAERFWAKVQVGGPTECWPWTAARNTKGYGQFKASGKLVPAHRWAYEQIVGKIPDGLQIDHLCRNRGCVNPGHMEPVTSKINTLRGVCPSGLNAVKVECIRGHSFDAPNTIVRPNGSRQCRTCQRQWGQEYWAQKRVTL